MKKIPTFKSVQKNSEYEFVDSLVSFENRNRQNTLNSKKMISFTSKNIDVINSYYKENFFRDVFEKNEYEEMCLKIFNLLYSTFISSDKVSKLGGIQTTIKICLYLVVLGMIISFVAIKTDLNTNKLYIYIGLSLATLASIVSFLCSLIAFCSSAPTKSASNIIKDRINCYIDQLNERFAVKNILFNFHHLAKTLSIKKIKYKN